VPSLHTVNKTPFERGSLETCLKLAASGGAVILIEDGVYAAVRDSAGVAMLEARKNDLKFFVLGPDLEARGIKRTRLMNGCHVVDYEGFVALAAEYDRVQSWL